MAGGRRGLLQIPVHMWIRPRGFVEGHRGAHLGTGGYHQHGLRRNLNGGRDELPNGPNLQPHRDGVLSWTDGGQHAHRPGPPGNAATGLPRRDVDAAPLVADPVARPSLPRVLAWDVRPSDGEFRDLGQFHPPPTDVERPAHVGQGPCGGVYVLHGLRIGLGHRSGEDGGCGGEQEYSCFVYCGRRRALHWLMESLHPHRSRGGGQSSIPGEEEVKSSSLSDEKGRGDDRIRAP
mmetsp:Transcript_13358/g.28907  ORF Transcript_13358/g.28907 Transcript_13358/m.28907 type:complete len:234 (+) Transcript_13358:1392-2093(+)